MLLQFQMANTCLVEWYGSILFFQNFFTVIVPGAGLINSEKNCIIWGHYGGSNKSQVEWRQTVSSDIKVALDSQLPQNANNWKQAETFTWSAADTSPGWMQLFNANHLAGKWLLGGLSCCWPDLELLTAFWNGKHTCDQCNFTGCIGLVMRELSNTAR